MVKTVFTGLGTTCVFLAIATTAGASTPYSGVPMAIPGTIQNEDFDNGAEGDAYHDDSPGNAGGQYRSTDVDIEANSAGYNIGWVSAGEWLRYTVTVIKQGKYRIDFRVASAGQGGTFHLEMNGVNVTGILTVPDTGGWQSWVTVSKTVTLAAGTQVARLVMDTRGVVAVGNFDYMQFNDAPSSPQRVKLTKSNNPPPPIVSPPPPGPAPSSGDAPTAYAAISDRIVRVKPPLPALGAAGYKFSDPTFGSMMLRVTDVNTRPAAPGTSFRTLSSPRSWNMTSTRFCLTATDGTVIPFSFDPAAMTASRIPGTGDGGRILAFASEAQFSSIDPDVIYGASTQYDHAVVTQYNFATDLYSVITDTRNIVPGVDNAGRTYLRGVQTGATSGTEYMTFIFGGGSQDWDRYAIWFPVGNLGARKLVDTLASTIDGRPTNILLGFYVHAVTIDLSGRYVILGATATAIAAGKAPNYIWDTLTDTFSEIRVHAGGHGAMGYAMTINNPDDADSMEWVARTLDAPNTVRELVLPYPTPLDFYAGSHANWANAQPDKLMPMIAAMFRYGGNTSPWREWDEEVIAIRTDGVETRVWRFAHHRSDYNHNGAGDTNTFWYMPRPVISPNGRWAMFTSNWEKTLGHDTREVNARQDVFLVKLQ